MIPHDRRSSARVDTGNLVIHSGVGQETERQVLGMAVTLDLNEFGIRIQTTDLFETGERFRFSVALKDEIIAATGRVVHIEETLNGTYEVGIEFLQISSQDIERIRGHCAGKKV